MPRSKKQPIQPTTQKPPEQKVEQVLPASWVQTKQDNRQVVYPTLEIDERSSTSVKGPVTPQWCEETMGWETEKQYQERMCAEEPGSKPEKWLFGDDYHCRDAYGNKVRCSHNAHNRPFDVDWCDSLTYTVLYGQWAGPFTLPGETVNGETIRISRYGEVLSGAHQMTACILAKQILDKARQAGQDHPDNPKYPVWRTHPYPFIECIVVKGVSDDPRVMMTVDYCKPRSMADVFYTSDVYRNSTSAQRRELCKLLAAACSTLWTRTDARGYGTHPEMAAFLERHKRLLDCAQHIFKLNNPSTGRKLTRNLSLNPGQCAALCYLMGCSVPDNDDGEVYAVNYRNADPAPNERVLNWGNWDNAVEFWEHLVNSRQFASVQKALGLLVTSRPDDEENLGMGGRTPEKLALLQKAWDVWKDHDPQYGDPFTDHDLEPGGALCLDYSDRDENGKKLPPGQVRLLDLADFLGIDCAKAVARSRAKVAPPEAEESIGTREEYQRAIDEASARRGRSVVDDGPSRYARS